MSFKSASGYLEVGQWVMLRYLQFLLKDNTCHPGVEMSFKPQLREHVPCLCKAGIAGAEWLVVMMILVCFPRGFSSVEFVLMNVLLKLSQSGLANRLEILKKILELGE